MTPFEKLNELEEFGGTRRTTGIRQEALAPFLKSDPTLAEAIHMAYTTHLALREERSGELALDEAELVRQLQQDYVNFYPTEGISPYVPIGAKGPWVVTSHGAVLHDSGGYGMLGFGHSPDAVIQTMGEPWVMANVMTASFSQKRLAERLQREVGRSRGSCPFARFICMNSGSESVTVAARISDVNALNHVREGGRHAGKPVKFLGLKGAFHGRTDRPAQVSDSTLPKYREVLRSFNQRDNLITVPANDVAALRAAFAQADAEGVFIEAMFMEPIQGEGDPGIAMTREFYDESRSLTASHGALLLVDSIQAGLRGHGCLSIVDYPGFEGCEPPDMETYSKALNGGQYPLSVLALTAQAAELYVRGVYGNTMTTNPRALEVACTTLDSVTDAMRENIRARGEEFLEKFGALVNEFPEIVDSAQGTGLLVALNIKPHVPVCGTDGLEERCRLLGLGVIHGGENALRFTPHFRVSSAEIDLIVDLIRAGLRTYSHATKEG